MNVLAPSSLIFVFAAGLLAGGQEGSFEKSLTVSGTVDLDVKTDSGGITVRQGSAGTVRIHAILKADHGWFISGSGDVEGRIRELERHPPVEQNGDRVRVGYVNDSRLLRGISMRLEIETPTSTQVRAHADSGGIRVEGVQGPVDCKTDSGGIQINDVSASVHAAADSGGIHVRNVKGSLFAHVDSGGIDATGIAGSIDAQADSGSVRLEQTTPATINAKVDSGGVTVRLARGAGYDVSAETDSGRVSVPEMTVRGAFSSHHIEGKVGGGGPLVKVRAESGSVTID
jgi:putative adhesin